MVKFAGPAHLLYRVLEAVVVLAVLLLLAVFLFRPFGATSRSFENLKGVDAQARLGDAWPQGVEPSEVSSVSHHGQSTIDSYSYWSRIELSPGAAAAWQDHIHAAEEEKIKRAASAKAGAEGVHRTVPGPISFRYQTGDEPPWWKPPESDFRATEGVRWTTDDRAAYGDALYSLFDEPTNTLWVYDYSAQHDALWTKGDVPPGRQFSLDAPSSPAAARERLGDRWPAGVFVKDVTSCQFDEGSVKFESDWGTTRTSWLKVKLTPAAAAVWEDDVHAREAERIRGLKKLNRLVEVVQRTTNGRLPPRMEVPGRPRFWDPPQASYRTTEGMIWGLEPAIPTGMALYSWFDPATRILWIYQNSSPRDVLWPQGKIPVGREIVNQSGEP